ncbi:MAG TPA: methyltransferase domain-containing protein [Terriglobales bacterium]|nr:methyltransferase domain-containing protein [Terriglobales bacterium]
MADSDSAPSAPSTPSWGASYRLVAAEKWKSKSAVMGSGVTQALVDYAAPQPGLRILDLATGTGEPGISLAQRCAPGGTVTAVDLSAELLELAAGRALKKNLSNFFTQQADAHELPFPDRSFDLATCRFGVMFFGDVKQALAELQRVLKPGSRACFVVWGSFEQPYWQTTMKIVRRHIGGELLDPGQGDPFRFAAAGSLSEALRSAGFRGVEESTQDVPWVWQGSAEEVFEYACAVSTPFRAMLERVPEAKWPRIRDEVHSAINRYRVGDEIQFGASVILASGKA